ncbi:MAG: hypothetical protein DI549_01375 [Ancylobacter novellus]|uniref:Uncharacterized protein n=1 Tax=Ancylobacter novellus TaxID=921 RepID=A0A2W5R7V0_ANCNO|nr:MAG: hypothetical protein DI549_01375 [Ancylobacter novellus]
MARRRSGLSEEPAGEGSSGPAAEGFSESAPHFLGHRERLRERFRQAGGDALPDYELLELVLFRAVPRADVKPLAKALVDRFGSFAEVITATPGRLREVKGVGEAIITEFKLIGAAVQRVTREAVKARPVLSSWSAVIAHCRASMAFAAQEEFRVLFLDKRNQLILDEVQQPSGDPTPSSADIQMTKTIIDVAKPLGIEVHDHIIVGKDGHASLRGLRLI